MLYVTAMLFQVGVIASVVLGIVCVFRRILVGSRMRRGVSTIGQDKVTPAVRSTRSPPGEKAPVEIWDHVVQFYSRDDELVDAVSGYLSAAIGAQEIAIVVATEEHRRAFDAAMAASGLDLAAARTSGSYIVADAAETVSRFVIGGRVDRDLFESDIGQLMRTASAAGRPIRVYGEMVALLWDAGQINAAIDLEARWNELGSVLPFSLYCAYPTDSVTGAAHKCRPRSHLSPARPWSDPHRSGTPTSSKGRSRSQPMTTRSRSIENASAEVTPLTSEHPDVVKPSTAVAPGAESFA